MLEHMVKNEIITFPRFNNTRNVFSKLVTNTRILYFYLQILRNLKRFHETVEHKEIFLLENKHKI